MAQIPDPQIQDNEAFFDEKIGPEMKRIAQLCEDKGIPMIATFQLTGGLHSPENPRNGMFCTTRVCCRSESSVLSVVGRILQFGASAIAIDIDMMQAARSKNPSDVN